MTPPTPEPDGTGPAPAQPPVHFDEPVDIDALWAAYGQSRSQDVRDRLILHFAPIVKFVAGRVGANLPSSVDTGDLASYGILGLIDAIEKFDAARGIKFETYAVPRIRGAILDELRALDWVPRSVRSKARELEGALTRLEARLRRAPTEEELAAEVGISVEDLHDQLAKVSQLSMVMLDDAVAAGTDRGERLSLLDTIEDLETPVPGESLEVAETREELQRAIEALPEREKLVVTLYYFERLTLAQIGEILRVTESRVSQIHTKAVLGLRVKLGSQAG